MSVNTFSNEADMEKASVHALISGRVQGVGFRMWTKKTAERYSVSGWVKNKRDGTVEAVFEGDKKRVELILEWCRQGPRFADVKNVDVTWANYTGRFKGFDITYAG